MKKSLKYFILSGFVLLLVALAACGSDSEEESDAEEVDTSGSSDEESATNEDIEGSVVVDGSGTVYPLMALLAENYMTNEQQGVSVEVGRAGTSAGFEKFLIEDGTDFNDASRQIKPEEKEKAEELNIEVKELKVALDGLTTVTHPENDWATELTEQQVIDIFLADGQEMKLGLMLTLIGRMRKSKRMVQMKTMEPMNFSMKRSWVSKI